MDSAPATCPSTQPSFLPFPSPSTFLSCVALHDPHTPSAPYSLFIPTPHTQHTCCVGRHTVYTPHTTTHPHQQQTAHLELSRLEARRQELMERVAQLQPQLAALVQEEEGLLGQQLEGECV